MASIGSTIPRHQVQLEPAHPLLLVPGGCIQVPQPGPEQVAVGVGEALDAEDLAAGERRAEDDSRPARMTADVLKADEGWRLFDNQAAEDGAIARVDDV